MLESVLGSTLRCAYADGRDAGDGSGSHPQLEAGCVARPAIEDPIPELFWSVCQLPSVMPYLPPRIIDCLVLCAARIEYGVGVVDMNKDLAWNGYIREQGDGTGFSIHRDMADGAGERRSRVGLA